MARTGARKKRLGPKGAPIFTVIEGNKGSKEKEVWQARGKTSPLVCEEAGRNLLLRLSWRGVDAKAL